ncbi:MAG: cell division protein SepF [bacterium]
MGLLNELKRLARPYEDEEEEFEDYSPRTPEKVPVTPRTAAPQRPGFSDFGTSERRDNKVVNIHATTQLQVVVVKPDRFDKSTEIADHLREKRTVVVNLEEVQKELQRRILDFLAGVAYAQDGKIQKIAVDTYLITPYNVDILGDLLNELENNGVYF